MIVGWSVDREEVTATSSEGTPAFIEGKLRAAAVSAFSRENEVRFRVVTDATRWDARQRRDVALPDVVVFADLDVVDCPIEVITGAPVRVRVAGRWRDFGGWAPVGSPARELKELVADLVEVQA